MDVIYEEFGWYGVGAVILMSVAVLLIVRGVAALILIDICGKEDRNA